MLEDMMTLEETERPADRRRGPLFYVGVLLVVLGLGVLGYVGWEYYGTTVVSKQKQQDIASGLEQAWSTAGRAVVEDDVEQPTTVALGDAMALVRIPRFGSDYVVPVVEGVGEEELRSGFGHFPQTADPGEAGNFALAGHRITNGEPLRNMPELVPGDEVVVETRDAIYTYVIDTDPNQLIVTFEDVWVIDPVPSNPRGGVEPPSQEPGQHLITLTTCADLFHTDDRMIAFGHLVDTQRK